MLLSLTVKNIALIDELTIELDKGLNIISGETGAGKSIIIDSLNFVLGDRADRSLIRHGESSASVQAVFEDVNDPEIIQRLEECGAARDEYIIVRRSMSDNGRGDCRVNGVPVTILQLKKLVTKLVDVHSQHENQSLLNEDSHIKILDGYAPQIALIKQKYAAAYIDYKQTLAELNTFGDSDARERKIDLYKYQIEEIDKAALKEGEEEKLLAEREKIANSARITYALDSALNILDGDGGFSAASGLYAAKKELNNIAKFDELYLSLASRLEDVAIEARDIAKTVKEELSKGGYDPEASEKVDKRIDEIRRIKKRYGGSLSEINAFYNKTAEELSALVNAESRIEELNFALEASSKATVKLAKELSAARRSAAIPFGEAIVKNLVDLGMKNSTFEAEILFPETDSEILSAASSEGADKVRFLISPNLGEPAKPLAKIASGGEMSRFMLGLKNITAEIEGIDTLVFDEIDTGISGVIAKVVARKLYDIAKTRQVLAVTHLPQLASMADSHYLITKNESNGKTLTSVRKLGEEEQLREIMRLQGSAEGSVHGLENAKELKNRAISYKITGISD